MEEKKAFEALSCAKEVVKVLERHHATVNDMERVLDIVKDMVSSSTLVRIEHLPVPQSLYREEPSVPVQRL